MDVKEKNNTEKTNAAAEPVAEDLNEVMRIRREKLAALVAEGKNVVLEIEVQGALQVMEKCPDATTIFIVPPSFEELERRIRGRRTEDEAIVQERLAKARKEIATKDEYKYVVENDDVMLAKEQIATIIKNHCTNQD